MTNQDAFKSNSEKTLEDRAVEAAAKIVTNGVGLKDGQISEGSDNQRANEAATAEIFSDKNLTELTRVDWDKSSKIAAKIIRARQKYICNDGNEREQKACLLAMAHWATRMDPRWQAQVKPSNWDVSDTGKAMAGYKKPDIDSIAGQFMAFFKIEATHKTPGNTATA